MARYGGPSVKRAQNLIVNDEGAFAAPARLDDRPYESMLPPDDCACDRAQSLVATLYLTMIPHGTSRW